MFKIDGIRFEGNTNWISYPNNWNIREKLKVLLSMRFIENWIEQSMSGQLVENENGCMTLSETYSPF